jgi:hypothetical protein
MLAAHEERFRWIYSEWVDRPGGDYAELLRGGEVSSPDGVDPQAWRRAIRRQARWDRIRVVTTRVDDARAFATLNRTVPPDQVLAVKEQALEQVVALGELRELTRVLGHALAGWARHDQEFISLCESCGARVYVQVGPEWIEDGEALTELCAAHQ